MHVNDDDGLEKSNQLFFVSSHVRGFASKWNRILLHVRSNILRQASDHVDFSRVVGENRKWWTALLHKHIMWYHTIPTAIDDSDCARTSNRRESKSMKRRRETIKNIISLTTSLLRRRGLRAATQTRDHTIQFDAKLFDKIAPTTANYHLNAINTRNDSHKSYFTRTKLLLV